MLRICARALAAALLVTAAAIAVRIPNEGLGVSVLYVGSSCVLAYAGFRRGGGGGHTNSRRSRGLFVLGYGASGSAHDERAGVPLRREGLGSGAS
jgi:hypothetical protein